MPVNSVEMLYSHLLKEGIITGSAKTGFVIEVGTPTKSGVVKTPQVWHSARWIWNFGHGSWDSAYPAFAALRKVGLEQEDYWTSVVQLNLIENWPPMPKMDIIFLRNVLIYFDVATKRRILGKIRELLRPDGYLFLGAAEMPMSVDNSFERVNLTRAGCYKLK